jgi:hypothetical protein
MSKRVGKGGGSRQCRRAHSERWPSNRLGTSQGGISLPPVLPAPLHPKSHSRESLWPRKLTRRGVQGGPFRHSSPWSATSRHRLHGNRSRLRPAAPIGNSSTSTQEATMDALHFRLAAWPNAFQYRAPPQHGHCMNYPTVGSLKQRGPAGLILKVANGAQPNGGSRAIVVTLRAKRIRRNSCAGKMARFISRLHQRATMASPQGHQMQTRNNVADLWPSHEADWTLANKPSASPESPLYILPWG